MEQKKPRKTKDQRMAELDAERMKQLTAELSEFQESYHVKLLHLVGEYSTHLPSWIKYVDNSWFVFTDMNSYSYDCVALDVQPTLVMDNFQQIRDDMETVQKWIQEKLDEERAAKELVAKKNAAMSKLTKEELKLLGLSL